MSYGGNPGVTTAAQRRDAVYLAVGDTVTTAQLLTDAEVNWFLGASDNGILAAAVLAARSIAASIMRQPRVANGSSSVDPTKTAQYYLDLAVALELSLTSIGVTASMDAGGISIADKETLESDSDWVQPAFEMGMDDQPGSYPRTSDDC